MEGRSRIELYAENVNVTVYLPKGWDDFACYGTRPFVLCAVCIPKFKDKLLALRTKIRSGEFK